MALDEQHFLPLEGAQSHNRASLHYDYTKEMRKAIKKALLQSHNRASLHYDLSRLEAKIALECCYNPTIGLPSIMTELLSDYSREYTELQSHNRASLHYDL
jgi:hypothetical protein